MQTRQYDALTHSWKSVLVCIQIFITPLSVPHCLTHENSNHQVISFLHSFHSALFRVIAWAFFDKVYILPVRIIKITRSHDRLSFVMGNHMPGKMILILKRRPSLHGKHGIYLQNIIWHVKCIFCQCKVNVILTKFPSLISPEVIKMTTFGRANVVNMTTLPSRGGTAPHYCCTTYQYCHCQRNECTKFAVDEVIVVEEAIPLVTIGCGELTFHRMVMLFVNVSTLEKQGVKL